MNISFITTVNHNIGDDFVREGLKYLIKQVHSGTIQFWNIHKHSPISARFGFEKSSNSLFSSFLDRHIPLSWTRDKVKLADILIQSGAPVYWCHPQCNTHCYQNEWYTPIMMDRFSPKTQLFANIAAGTCQTYHSNGLDFCSRCLNHIRSFESLSSLTTVRDQLAQVLLNSIGKNVNRIPCCSIFAIDQYDISNSGEDYVVVNFMENASHYTFNQEIQGGRWKSIFTEFYRYLKKKENVVFVCHDEKEVGLALSIDPNGKIFYEKNDFLSYMHFYSKAKIGIFNRVHGAFLLSSFGKPSIVIGNDSRARMTDEIGITNLFVNDVDFQMLIHHYQTLCASIPSFRDVIFEIKRSALQKYFEALSILF